jgi:hypothetical protein
MQPDEDRTLRADLTQVLLIGSVGEPAFTSQLNGALQRLARSGHEVLDIKFVADNHLYSALVLYRPDEADI